MSRRGRRSSYVNLKLSGGGSKKAGLVNSWEWSTIPRSILASNTSVVNYDQTIPNNDKPVDNTIGTLNSFGFNNKSQLGDGTTTNRSIPTPITDPNIKYKYIAAGYDFGLGIAEDNSLYGWGNNNYVFGNNTNSNSSIPLKNNFSNTNIFKTISAAIFHVLALDNNGKLYSWGDNTSSGGAIGNGSATGSVSTPYLIVTTQNLTFKSIAAGPNFSLAVSTTNQLYAWGQNNQGQLGVAQSTTQYLVPTLISSPINFDQVSASKYPLYFSLALSTSGTLYGWGQNNLGQLGLGNNNTPIIGPTNTSNLIFKSIDAGTGHSLGLTTEGILYSWGFGSQGALGNGSTAIKNTPSLTTQGTTIFKSISAGSINSYALTTDDKLYACGENTFGQIGNGTSGTSVNSLTAVQPSMSFKSISGGNYFALSIV